MKHIEMKKKSVKKSLVKRALIFVTTGLVITATIIAASLWHLSTVIDKRFSARKWSIPSKVYSDSTILYVGQAINLKLFHEKLNALGYCTTSAGLRQKGEFIHTNHSIDIYLNDFETPLKHREGFPVRIALKDNRIVSMTKINSDQQLTILELEPEEIMLLFGSEREMRQLVSIDDIPIYLKYAVLAAEDSRFFLHHGIDMKGIFRALYTNVRHGKILQGGSTLTQQLAKNYFLTPERTILRKFKEFLIAITIEQMYEKNEILEIYLNEIYFGQKGSIAICGIGEASYFYFGKPVQRLSLSEAATIAGLIKGPNKYSPYTDRNLCKERRNAVLHDIYNHGWITSQEYNIAASSPLQPAGYRTYRNRAPYFIDYLAGQLPLVYSPEVLSSLGLSIYTTLDTQVQSAVETALQNGLIRLENQFPELKREEADKPLQGAIVVMQPKTGYILAMAGGRNYAVSQFNRITQAKRQPGSAFKPFVYLAGLDQFTPSSLLSNEPKTYAINGKQWQPQNTNPTAKDGIRLRTALATSDNLATVDLAMKIGLEKIVGTAKHFCFSTSMAPQPSLSLGAFEVIPLELARAYCTFAADGVQPYPLSTKAVIDEDGTIKQRQHLKIERIISPAHAYIMNSLLRSVITEGTARSLSWWGITFPAAGKTGTTNDNRDAWFVGYTPDILALIWIGFDNGESIHGGGAAAALPVWTELMQELPQYISGNWFRKPEGIVSRIICSQSGKLAIRGKCPESLKEIFLSTHIPTEYCSIHR